MKPTEEKQFSSFEEQQVLFENWRRHLNEQAAATRQSPKAIKAENERIAAQDADNFPWATAPRKDVIAKVKALTGLKSLRGPWYKGKQTPEMKAARKGFRTYWKNRKRGKRRAKRRAQPAVAQPTTQVTPNAFKDPKTKKWMMDLGGGKTRPATKEERAGMKKTPPKATPAAAPTQTPKAAAPAAPTKPTYMTPEEAERQRGLDQLIDDSPLEAATKAYGQIKNLLMSRGVWEKAGLPAATAAPVNRVLKPYLATIEKSLVKLQKQQQGTPQRAATEYED